MEGGRQGNRYENMTCRRIGSTKTLLAIPNSLGPASSPPKPHNLFRSVPPMTGCMFDPERTAHLKSRETIRRRQWSPPPPVPLVDAVQHGDALQ